MSEEMPKLTLTALFLLVLSSGLFVQMAATETYEVRVSTERADRLYKTGEHPNFTVEVVHGDSRIAEADLKYECGPETLPATHSGTVKAGVQQPVRIEAGTMSVPGFLRCTASFEKNGQTYTGMATVAFSPENIVAAVKEPADFDEFWKRQLAEGEQIPLEPILVPMPEKSTAKVEVYKVSFQTVGTGFSKQSRIYGVLAVPRTSDKSKRFPALLRVPGAGVRPYNGQISLAEKGMITLEVGIHGIPIDLPQTVYDDLRAGALNRYMLYNLDDRETYYYRRVYLGMIRAVDMLASLPQFDGRNIAVLGGSQGGALAIVTAALDKRVTALAASYPALSDMAGYTAGRAGGWPHAFKDEKMRTKEKLATAAYYDVVNFAKRIKVPGIYSWGFNDVTCPPTSMYAAYNVIKASKTLLISPEMGHANSPEQTAKINEWIIAELLK